VAKAVLLGDNGDLSDEDEEELDFRRNRIGLGGARGRIQRLAPRSTGPIATLSGGSSGSRGGSDPRDAFIPPADRTDLQER
jgi:hypothetical protein